MIRRIGRAQVASVWLVAFACGGEQSHPRTGPPPPAPRPPLEAPRDAVEPLDEASARALVAARFRAAGYRVVEDVALRGEAVELTLDGFDPARRVGYEYVAADERDADLADDERAGLTGLGRVLIIDSAGADAIAAAVDRFLAGLDPMAGPDAAP